jgi:hypothetical protein
VEVGGFAFNARPGLDWREKCEAVYGPLPLGEGWVRVLAGSIERILNALSQWERVGVRVWCRTVKQSLIPNPSPSGRRE